MVNKNKFVTAAALIFSIATIDAIALLLGLWSPFGEHALLVWSVSGAVLLGLLLLSFSIKNWVYKNSNNPLHRKVAWLSFISLILCVGGDIINANFPQTFYRHGGVIKHDYLADSVSLFGPGYLLLLINGALVAAANQIQNKITYGAILLGAFFGVATFALMHLPGTGLYVTAITGSYAALVTAVAALGLVIVYSFGGLSAPLGVKLVGLGFVLVCVADAVIGNFWIYGNNGEGFFPAVRYVNWILYIGSQCLVIFLPYVFVLYNKRPENYIKLYK